MLQNSFNSPFHIRKKTKRRKEYVQGFWICYFYVFFVLFALIISPSYDFALCLLSVIYLYSSHFFIIRLTFLFPIPPFFYLLIFVFISIFYHTSQLSLFRASLFILTIIFRFIFRFTISFSLHVYSSLSLSPSTAAIAISSRFNTYSCRSSFRTSDSIKDCLMPSKTSVVV